jgi:MFS family permease
MPSAGYAHYRDELDLADAEVTALFAVLVVLVMTSLWWCRRHDVGRRRGEVLVVAVFSAAIADVLFVLTGSYAELLVASALQGVAVGLVCGLAPAATTAALRDAGRAGRWMTVANGAGMAAGPVLAGLGNEFLPLPYVLVFVVHASACLVFVVPLAAIRDDAVAPARAAVDASASIGTGLRTTLATGYLAFFAGGLFVSLTAVLVVDVLRQDPTVAPGALIAALFAANAVVGGLLTGRPRHANRIGTALFVAGLLLTITALSDASLVLLAVAAVVTGAGQGALVGAALVRAACADSANGGNAATASLFICGYCGAASAALAVGWVSGRIGPGPAFLILLGTAVAGMVIVELVDRGRTRSYAE